METEKDPRLAAEYGVSEIPTLKAANGGRSQADAWAEAERRARIAVAESIDRDFMGPG